MVGRKPARHRPNRFSTGTNGARADEYPVEPQDRPSRREAGCGEARRELLSDRSEMRSARWPPVIEIAHQNARLVGEWRDCREQRGELLAPFARPEAEVRDNDAKRTIIRRKVDIESAARLVR